MPDELANSTRPGALEGSRFIILQLYRLAAGGSHERLHVMQFYRESRSHGNGTDTMGKHHAG